MMDTGKTETQLSSKAQTTSGKGLKSHLAWKCALTLPASTPGGTSMIQKDSIPSKEHATFAREVQSIHSPMYPLKG